MPIPDFTDPGPPGQDLSAEQLAGALAVLRDGGVLGYPSGTVWGLAALPQDRGAVERLYRLKGRDAGKPVQLSVQDRPTASAWVRPGQPGFERAAALWPLPLTLLAWAAPDCPRWLAPPQELGRPGELDEYGPEEGAVNGGVVGLRVPGHPLALALLRGAGGSLATTSLNRSGEPAARTRAEAEAYRLADLLIGEDVAGGGGGLASTVVDTRSGAVLREGAVSRAELARLLGGTG